MLSYITLGSTDSERPRRFYEPVMTAIGLQQPFELPSTIAFGDLAGLELFIVSPFDGGAASCSNGQHVALLVPERASVDAFHVALAKAERMKARPA